MKITLRDRSSALHSAMTSCASTRLQVFRSLIGVVGVDTELEPLLFHPHTRGLSIDTLQEPVQKQNCCQNRTNA